MTNPINTVDLETYKTLYSSNYNTLYQQGESFLSQFCAHEAVTGENYTIETISKKALNKRKAKYTPIKGEQSKYERRFGTCESFSAYEYLDEIEDVLKAKINPQSDIMQQFVKAERRKLDELILKCPFSTVKGGKDGSSDILFPTDNVVAHGGVGLTLSKLHQLNELAIGNDIPQEEAIIVVIGRKQYTELMGINEVINTDFNDFHPLPTLKHSPGIVGQYLNLLFVVMNEPAGATATSALYKSGSTRNCLAFVNRSLHVATPKSRSLLIDRRVDLDGQPIQLGIEAHYGTLRTREEAVFKIQCNE
jgi:hypothetical protein